MLDVLFSALRYALQISLVWPSILFLPDDSILSCPSC